MKLYLINCQQTIIFVPFNVFIYGNNPCFNVKYIFLMVNKQYNEKIGRQWKFAQILYFIDCKVTKVQQILLHTKICFWKVTKVQKIWLHTILQSGKICTCKCNNECYIQKYVSKVIHCKEHQQKRAPRCDNL